MGRKRARTVIPTGLNYLLLEETLPPKKGWGTVAVNPSATRELIVEVPHPYYDMETEAEGTDIFRRTGARALIVAGSHRCANTEFTPCTGTADVCGGIRYCISDAAHFAGAPFEVVHETFHRVWGGSVALSVHGHSDSACEDVFLSSGVATDPGSLVPLLRENLLAQGGITAGAAGVPGSTCDLTGASNVQGRFSNGSTDPCKRAASSASGRFVHAEQSRRTRTDPARYGKLIRALRETVPAVTRAPGLCLPSSARAWGEHGTFFTTDLVLTNPGAVEAHVTLRFAEHDTDGRYGNVRSVVLPPGGTLRFSSTRPVFGFGIVAENATSAGRWIPAG